MHEPSTDPVLRARRIFDSAADGYDAPALRFLSEISAEVVARLGVDRSARVLDVACGTGHATAAVVTALGPDGHVTALDISEAMLERAEARCADYGAQVTLRVADMRSIDEADGSFDVVLCVFGVMFVADISALIAELWRLVAPGGRLVIVTWAPGDMSPVKRVLVQCVHELRPDLVPSSVVDAAPSATSTRTGMTELIRAAGVEVPVEHTDIAHQQPLASPEAWWEIVMGSGLRGFVEALDANEADEVKRRCEETIRLTGITHVSCDALMTVIARRRSAAVAVVAGSHDSL